MYRIVYNRHKVWIVTAVYGDAIQNDSSHRKLTVCTGLYKFAEAQQQLPKLRKWLADRPHFA